MTGLMETLCDITAHRKYVYLRYFAVLTSFPPLCCVLSSYFSETVVIFTHMLFYAQFIPVEMFGSNTFKALQVWSDAVVVLSQNIWCEAVLKPLPWDVVKCKSTLNSAAN